MIKDKKGAATLVEILVSVAIMGILSSIFIVNIRTGNRDKLSMAAEQLAADLRQIRNMSFSRTIYDMSKSGKLEYPPGGYGISVVNNEYNKYKIFADNGDNNNYQSDEDELIKEIVLEDGFDIKVSNSHFFITFLTEHNLQYGGGNVIYNPIRIRYEANYIDITLDYLEGDDNYWGNIVVGDIE